jgi:hypothetical protein
MNEVNSLQVNVSLAALDRPSRAVRTPSKHLDAHLADWFRR